MSKMKFVFVVIALFTVGAWACTTSGKKSEIGKVKSLFKTSARKPSAVPVKFADGNKNPSLESQLANLLLDHNSRSVVLSLPVQIQKSSFHPFGDGQSNAKMSLGSGWKSDGFPVVGVQTSVDGKTERKYLFHPALNVTKYSETKIDGIWYKVQPEGWQDSFYFSFETSTLLASDFLKGIPESYRTFSGGRVAPDLGHVGKGSGIERFKNLGEGYNTEAWFSESVHGIFPDAGGSKTALGGVLTWGLVDKKFGPFKNLYTCFQPRNIVQEKTEGVPSGAGWHLIGDAAETLLNDLETAPIPVAVGRSHSFGDAAYGLSESLTAVWLQPEEVLVTSQGMFHWYVNPYEAPVCTEIWVHNCVPAISNNWGFNCR